MADTMYSEQYMNAVENELQRRGIPYTWNMLGIRFSTGLDSWAVDVSHIQGDATVVPVLYHKNMFKCRFGSIPDYHVQMRKPISAKNLIHYAVHHKEKYGVQVAV
ncbi:MAG: hypothetical protein LUE86_10225 [Clostridiales bacterium]|nr:hypothetical protein [Clostridiales bacterium]